MGATSRAEGEKMFQYFVRFQGTKSKDVSSRTFDLTGGDYATALAEAAAIKAELDDVTTAEIILERISEVISESNAVPATAADTFECAVVNVHLNAPTEREKLHTLYIPAPVAGMFLADGTTLDISNTDLQAYVAAIAASALVSDGETIQTGTGTAGIKDGYLLSKAKNFR
jgi:hypothetical protein